THTGGTFHIVRCPMPPVAYWWIFPYYKSYINSVLFNGLALIPIYGLEWDNEAIAAYQEALGPEWTVVGIDCNSIAPAGGAIHCTTIAVPDHIESYNQDVTLTFAPVSAPIIIPAGGGSFNYDVTVENLENDNILFDFWVDVTLPDGTVYGPLFIRNSVTLTALANVGRELSQTIPAPAPEGTYSYNGYIGSYLPLVINDQGSFTFEKTAASDGAYNENDWPVIGWNGDTELRNILEVPSRYVLKNNMPNPFNPETSISFELPEAADVRLSIYNVNGQLVETLAEGLLSAGNHSYTWNAQNMPSGVYFYSLEANGAVQTRKMVLMK
nr:agmatine deiminase family protein [FCB group bacterium]